MKPLHSGEVQFVRYSDSSKGGPCVTFRLSSREDLEAYIGMEAKRMMYSTVLIGDDELPADPPTRAASTKGKKLDTSAQPVQKAPESEQVAKIVTDAAMVCKNPAFQRFARAYGYQDDESGAKHLVYHRCGIASRRELPTNGRAAAEFRGLMKAYREWAKTNTAQEAEHG